MISALASKARGFPCTCYSVRVHGVHAEEVGQIWPLLVKVTNEGTLVMNIPWAMVCQNKYKKRSTDESMKGPKGF